ncbi:alpha-E domain-containing protein, partial [Mycobacterium sp. NAZ190054]|uniref:alpha-E domain-containing protein n=1 Tax=Mycobacterium sp. NAZ190054 TaxID=1747766 RepID=UPI001E40A090
TLVACESLVIYRRRNPGKFSVTGVAELVLFDAGNPRSLVYQLVRAPPRRAGAAAGTSPAAGAAAAADDEMSALTVLGRSPLSAPPAVMRSVSVTDFLSSLADQVTRGFSALSRSAERRGHTIATATAIARSRRNTANRQSTKLNT